MNIKKIPCHAYIVNSTFPENIGRPVEVFQRMPDIACEVMWMIRVSPDSAPLKVMQQVEYPMFPFVIKGFMPGMLHECQAPDYALKPIDGIDLGDENETGEPKVTDVEYHDVESV